MIFIAESFGDRVALHVREKYGSQVKAAKALGCSHAYINLIIHGKKPPSDLILDDMGLVRVVSYVLTDAT